jgi:tetratricopeptide (TPR) repeat protein
MLLWMRFHHTVAPLALTALLLAPASGGAVDLRVAAAPNPHLAKARALYQDLEYEQALARLEKALTWKGTSNAERVDIYVYTGLCRYQLGDEKGARNAFREALSMDPRASLPRLTSPKIQRVFQQESELLASSRPVRPPPEPEPEPRDEPPPEPDPRDGLPSSGEDVVADQTERPYEPPLRRRGGSSSTDEPSDFWRDNWPALAAGGAAVVLGGIAAYFGYSAQQSAEAAGQAGSAANAKKNHEAAQSSAMAANVLYGLSGAAAAAGVAFVFVF